MGDHTAQCTGITAGTVEPSVRSSELPATASNPPYLRREHISQNVHKEHEEQLTLGQKTADMAATFGGSAYYFFES